MGNRTHDLGMNSLAHTSGMLYHYPKSLCLNGKVHRCRVANPTYVYMSGINVF